MLRFHDVINDVMTPGSTILCGPSSRRTQETL